jgi:hypothetical protein
MLGLFLDAMNLIFIGYFLGIAVMLFRINLSERKERGMTTRQALKDMMKDLFYIQRIGGKDE